MALYYLLLIDFMLIYVMYLYQVKLDPGFDISHPKEAQKNLMGEVFTATSVVLFTYYFWFALSLSYNCIGGSPKRDPVGKVVFIISNLFHVSLMFGALSGVFSKNFSNGGMQFFFWGLSNLYMVALVYFYWPI